MAAVAEALIVGDGHDESRWQLSPWLASRPHRDAAALLATHERVVVVSPHPDDETLACGGLMRAAARAGRTLSVVSVTDGEACYPGNGAWPPERLRVDRASELAAALRALDTCATLHRLHLPDGGVAAAAATLRTALAKLVGPGDLVLAPWEHDGHPDHDAVGAAALSVVPAAGAALLRYPVWAWHWLDHARPAPPFPAVRMPLDEGARRAKRAAIGCFASQLGTAAPAVAEPVLAPHVVARFERPFEVYLT